MLGSHRVLQYTSFPLKNARFTPASRAAVRAGAAVSVVCLPRFIGGLVQHVRPAGVITDDEDDVAGARFLQRYSELAETTGAVGVRAGWRFGRRLELAVVSTPCARRVGSNPPRDGNARGRVGSPPPR